MSEMRWRIELFDEYQGILVAPTLDPEKLAMIEAIAGSHDLKLARLDHVLCIDDEDGCRVTSIDHLPDCPMVERWAGDEILGAPPIMSYSCAVGVLWDECGADGITDFDKIPPGRYVVRVEHMVAPSTPNGPAEYDAWLEVE